MSNLAMSRSSLNISRITDGAKCMPCAQSDALAYEGRSPSICAAGVQDLRQVDVKPRPLRGDLRPRLGTTLHLGNDCGGSSDWCSYGIAMASAAAYRHPLKHTSKNNVLRRPCPSIRWASSELSEKSSKLSETRQLWSPWSGGGPIPLQTLKFQSLLLQLALA